MEGPQKWMFMPSTINITQKKTRKEHTQGRWLVNFIYKKNSGNRIKDGPFQTCANEAQFTRLKRSLCQLSR